jgi:hypothetical protein
VYFSHERRASALSLFFGLCQALIGLFQST